MCSTVKLAWLSFSAVFQNLHLAGSEHGLRVALDVKLARLLCRQHDGKIGEVQDALRGVASTALGSWAAWAGAHLAQDLAGGYSNDNALTAACALRGWQVRLAISYV